MESIWSLKNSNKRYEDEFRNPVLKSFFKVNFNKQLFENYLNNPTKINYEKLNQQFKIHFEERDRQ